MGNEIPGVTRHGDSANWLAVVAVIGVAVFGVWFFAIRETPLPPAGREVALKQILDAYSANEVAADGMFKDSRVRVAGRVKSIGEGLGGGAYVVVAPTDGYSERDAQLAFMDESRGRVAGASVGAELVADCTVRGLMLNVQMADCR